MSDAVRVLVVDDEALVRHALRAFLAGDDRVELVGEVADGSEAVEACETLEPDVVLMDMKMRDVSGIEATRRLLRRNPHRRVVALTTFTTEWRALEALRAGACGYLVKNSTPEEIIEAIVAAHAGDRVVSPAVQSQFVRELIDSNELPVTGASELSARERRIVELIAEGLSNAEIAEALHFAEATVKADIRHINQIWNVGNRLQIVVRAVGLGIAHL